MEKLNKVEHDRRMEIEIEHADKEAEINEQLERARHEAEAEQKAVLKDRQTQEKVAMFGAMMKKMDDGDNMKQYLEMQMKDATREAVQFKEQAEREKDRRIAEMETEKERQMQELMDRQERMFDWDDRQNRDQDKIMEQFKRQKEEMMAKKLADQQKEILNDMNQEDVDALLAKHKRQLQSMDQALSKE